MRVIVDFDLPNDGAWLQLPEPVARRLQVLLTRRSSGEVLSVQESEEMTGLADLNAFFATMRMRLERPDRKNVV